MSDRKGGRPLHSLSERPVRGPAPNGPSLGVLLQKLRRILEKKCLILAGALTSEQLDLVVSELPSGGLWIDVAIVEREVVATSK